MFWSFIFNNYEIFPLNRNIIIFPFCNKILFFFYTNSKFFHDFHSVYGRELRGWPHKRSYDPYLFYTTDEILTEGGQYSLKRTFLVYWVAYPLSRKKLVLKQYNIKHYMPGWLLLVIKTQFYVFEYIVKPRLTPSWHKPDLPSAEASIQ